MSVVYRFPKEGRRGNDWKSPMAPARLLKMEASPKYYLPYAIIVAVFLIATGTGVELYQNREQPPAPTGKLAFGKSGAEPPHIRGPAKAPVALEEFGDFECLPCSVLYPILKKVEADYGERLSVTFREYPLARHKHAFEAACAAEAAGLQDRFWEMHDWLYENRLDWLSAVDTRAALVSAAAKLGLNVEKFQKDMDSEEVNKHIKADVARLVSLELNRTPTVFVNGDRVTTAPITLESLHAAIDAGLGNQK
jgi:protein-disulfide isomerase